MFKTAEEIAYGVLEKCANKLSKMLDAGKLVGDDLVRGNALRTELGKTPERLAYGRQMGERNRSAQRLLHNMDRKGFMGDNSSARMVLGMKNLLASSDTGMITHADLLRMSHPNVAAKLQRSTNPKMVREMHAPYTTVEEIRALAKEHPESITKMDDILASWRAKGHPGVFGGYEHIWK